MSERESMGGGRKRIRSPEFKSAINEWTRGMSANFLSINTGISRRVIDEARKQGKLMMARHLEILGTFLHLPEESYQPFIDLNDLVLSETDGLWQLELRRLNEGNFSERVRRLYLEFYKAAKDDHPDWAA